MRGGSRKKPYHFDGTEPYYVAAQAPVLILNAVRLLKLYTNGTISQILFFFMYDPLNHTGTDGKIADFKIFAVGCTTV
jgi:hypothetical protein